jgi:hypothetical protein
VVEHLIAGDASRPRDRQRLLQVVDVEVADPPGTDLPVADELLEGLDGSLERVPRAPVEEMGVEAIRSQAAEARLALKRL